MYLRRDSMRILFLLVLVFGCASNGDKKVDKSKKKAEIYYNRGTEELVNKDYTAALKYLIQAGKLSPKDSRILNNLGMAYFFKQRVNLAIKYISKSIELDPANTRAKLNLATVYMENKQFQLAEKNFNNVLEDLTFDQQFRTYYNLGTLSLKRKKLQQAINFFNQSLAENENYCPSHFQKGLIFYDQKKYDNALDSFKAAGRGVCYNNPEPLYYQALAHIKLNQIAPAKERLEDIIGRFSGTNFAKNAQRKLNSINLRLDQYEAKVLRGEDPYRQILTPNF